MDSTDATRLYTPLDEARNEIRLLTFRSLPNDSHFLECDISVHSLDDITTGYQAHLLAEQVQGWPRRKVVSSWVAKFPEAGTPKAPPPPEACRFAWGDFETLSYVWGSEEGGQTIMVNDRTVVVTNNLAIALGAMARTGYYTGSHRLWVDALCINQQDEEEQASQISKMRHIYGAAWNVVAWLGEAADASNAAFDLLEGLASFADASANIPFGKFSIPSYMFFGHYFYGLNELMQREYWSRLWIVQELVLGSSAVVLRCGDRIMDWQTFCGGITVLHRPDLWIIKDYLLLSEVKRHGLGGEQYDPRWATLWLHLIHKDIQVLGRYEEQGTGALGLRRLLDIAITSNCRDTRDKVFALLGMMEPGIAATLAHDYSNTPATLFANVARAFITHFGNLEPLREGNPWSKVNAPSWAPDWTWTGRLRYSRPEMPLWGFWTLSAEPQPAADKIYNAAGDHPARYSFDGDRLLRCTGFVVDSVGGLGAIGRGYWGWDADPVVQCSNWQSIYGSEEGTARALCHTLFVGRMSGGRPPEPRHAAILSLPRSFNDAMPQFEERGWTWMASQEGYYFRWELWREAHDNILIGSKRLGDYFSDVIPEEATERDYAEVYGAFDRTSKERRFMLTANGYLGWAPDNISGSFSAQTRKGDLVCILFGCSTPLIIRPVIGGRFRIIGQAYVEGLMDGEALKLLETNQCNVEEFCFA